MAKEVFDFAGTDDIAGLKELWYRCFDIDGVYGDFYFQNRFVPEDTLICRKNEQIAAMLTLAEVAISGERGYYLYALATLPEFRNQGIMRAMIRRSEEEIRRRNGTFSCLRPVSSDLFSMYEKLDYETDFFRFFGTLKREEAEKAIFSFRLCEFEDFYRRRLDYLKKQKNPVTHSRKEHLFIYRDLEKSGGGVVLYEEDGKEQYIAYTCGKDDLTVKEISGIHPEAASRALMIHGEKQKVMINSAVADEHLQWEPLGMGKYLAKKESSLTAHFGGSGYMALMLD